MKYFTIFSRETEYHEIMASVCRAFGINKPYEGDILNLSNQYQTIKVTVLTNTMEEQDRKLIREQKNMVCGFFSHIQNCDEDIKINLIHHIQQSGMFLFIENELKAEKKTKEEEEESLEMVQEAIFQAMKPFDSVFITDEGCTARNGNGELILAEDGSSGLDFYFPFSYQETPKFLETCTDRQKTRRKENMKLLFDRRIYVTELPLNDDDEKVKLRKKKEVVKRVLGLLVVSLYSEALLNPAEQMDIPEARKFIKRVQKDFKIKDLKEILTKEELQYINNDASSEQERIQYSWNYEHLYLLEWALGLAEWTEPNDICDVSLTVRRLRPFDSIDAVCKGTKLRPKKEILDMADLVYRMDWAAVDARIHGMTGPAGLNHGVVQARHKSLNWLICFGGDDWDRVDTPT